MSNRRKYNPNLPLYWALDFNVNHMSSVICQIDEWKRTPWATAPYECKKTVRVLDEMVINDSNTSEAAEEFIHRAKVLIGTTTRTSVNIYGDSSGNSRSSKSPQTDYELIRRAFQRYPEFQHQHAAKIAPTLWSGTV